MDDGWVTLCLDCNEKNRLKIADTKRSVKNGRCQVCGAIGRTVSCRLASPNTAKNLQPHDCDCNAKDGEAHLAGCPSQKRLAGEASPNFISGHTLMNALLEAGIIGPGCTRVVIDCDMDGAVVVYTRDIGDKRLLEIDWQGVGLSVRSESPPASVMGLAGGGSLDKRRAEAGLPPLQEEKREKSKE